MADDPRAERDASVFVGPNPSLSSRKDFSSEQSGCVSFPNDTANSSPSVSRFGVIANTTDKSHDQRGFLQPHLADALVVGKA